MRRVSIKHFSSTSEFKINIFGNKADVKSETGSPSLQIFVTGGYLKAEIKIHNETFVWHSFI